MDVILVCSTDKGSLTEVRRNLFQMSPDLTFTFEEAEGGELQYSLDFILSTEPGLYWRVVKRSPKSLLLAVSSHPKAVKNAIISTLINPVMKKTCFHKVDQATTFEMERLCSPGHCLDRVLDVTGRKFLRDCLTERMAFDKNKTGFPPFIHGVPTT